MTDVTVIINGEYATMWSIRPNTDAAREWIQENVESPEWMPENDDGTIIGDWRPMRDIARGMAAAGFTVANQYGAMLRA